MAGLPAPRPGFSMSPSAHAPQSHCAQRSGKLLLAPPPALHRPPETHAQPLRRVARFADASTEIAASGPSKAKSIALASDASRLASLLLSYIPAICAFVAPRQPGASTAIIDQFSHSRALRGATDGDKYADPISRSGITLRLAAHSLHIGSRLHPRLTRLGDACGRESVRGGVPKM
jgi:hypothetical protein